MAPYLHCCPELNPTNCFVFRSDYLETEEILLLNSNKYFETIATLDKTLTFFKFIKISCIATIDHQHIKSLFLFINLRR
ncbi:hypothetical protein QR98_0063350 [Sarcoptes scabiei]|uniref:Uncharacterized protein n=1 Tax=Sarcoptes scabiei TaxID=52283 RepID=A0A132AAA9_SARSC|nr:hypothetical protein QR98_0063350 [Sarcoptes scabiei]